MILFYRSRDLAEEGADCSPGGTSDFNCCAPGAGTRGLVTLLATSKRSSVIARGQRGAPAGGGLAAGPGFTPPRAWGQGGKLGGSGSGSVHSVSSCHQITQGSRGICTHGWCRGAMGRFGVLVSSTGGAAGAPPRARRHWCCRGPDASTGDAAWPRGAPRRCSLFGAGMLGPLLLSRASPLPYGAHYQARAPAPSDTELYRCRSDNDSHSKEGGKDD